MTVSLDSILEGFNPKVSSPEDYTTLTLWVPKGVKAKYKLIQQSSGRDFSKVLTQLVEAAISKAEQKSG